MNPLTQENSDSIDNDMETDATELSTTTVSIGLNTQTSIPKPSAINVI